MKNKKSDVVHVSMQRPPYCIDSGDLYWPQIPVEKKKSKLYFCEIGLICIHIERQFLKIIENFLQSQK